MTENEAKNFHVNTDMFGQYAKIPTGRSGDLHIYKIITRFHSNWYCDVPIIGLGDSTLHEEVTDVLNVIHCGVDESKVIRVALKDCEIIENEETKELRKYRKIGTVEECRAAVGKQKPKKRIYPKTALERYYHAPECPNCKRELKPRICGYTLSQAIGIYSYCPWCGQNLEGREESEGE